MALREPLCACVREWGKERARASPPRFELHNQVLRSLLRTLRHWGLLQPVLIHLLQWVIITQQGYKPLRWQRYQPHLIALNSMW